MRHPVLSVFLLCCLCLPLRAQGLGLPPLTDQFAACSGRLMAMMEYQWMQDDPTTEETAQQMRAMHELLAAVADPDQDGLIRAREHEAKLGFERLLSRFGQDGGDWAKARAAAELAACTSLLME